MLSLDVPQARIRDFCKGGEILPTLRIWSRTVEENLGHKIGGQEGEAGPKPPL